MNKKSVTLAVLTPDTHIPTASENGDNIIIPTRLRIEKDGSRTALFCADTGRELQLPFKAHIKLDMGDLKSAVVKIAFDCSVSAVEFVERQTNLPGVK